MRRTGIMVGLMTVFSFCQAQYAGFSKLEKTESFRQSFSVATKSTQSIQADFLQEKSMSLLSEKILSRGKFWYKRGNNLRMEYLQPFSYLIIFQGDKILIRDGHTENKFSTSSNKTFQQVNRILVDCVSGDILENRDFETQVFENANSYLVELKPIAKNLKELYKNINIVIDKKDDTANAIEMFEVSGDKTIIRFQNKIINATLPGSLFSIP
jgi:outer membrane lipoprotein-sorting protein